MSLTSSNCVDALSYTPNRYHSRFTAGHLGFTDMIPQGEEYHRPSPLHYNCLSDLGFQNFPPTFADLPALGLTVVKQVLAGSFDFSL